MHEDSAPRALIPLYMCLFESYVWVLWYAIPLLWVLQGVALIREPESSYVHV